MGIDPAPFWATGAYKCRATSQFIDDLWTIHDQDEFSKCFKCIYPGELEVKLEHSGTHATFLDLVIKIEDGIFVYNVFDKRQISTFHCPHAAFWK